MEILDEITRLKYEKSCSLHINGPYRNALIQQFLSWKGMSYNPNHIHPSLHWNESNPLYIQNTIISSWQLVQTKSTKHSSEANIQYFIAATDSVPIISNLLSVSINNKKCKASTKGTCEPQLKKTKFIDETSHLNIINNKKQKLATKNDEKTIIYSAKKPRLLKNIPDPKGFIWDSDNYSCAYDSLFTILHLIWLQNPIKWKQQFKQINKTMGHLALGFEEDHIGQCTLENVRDNIQHMLHRSHPIIFPYNYSGTDIHDLAHFILETNVIALPLYK